MKNLGKQGMVSACLSANAKRNQFPAIINQGLLHIMHTPGYSSALCSSVSTGHVGTDFAVHILADKQIRNIM